VSNVHLILMFLSLLTQIFHFVSRNEGLFLFPSAHGRPSNMLMFREFPAPDYQAQRGYAYQLKLSCAPGTKGGNSTMLKEDIPRRVEWVMNGFEFQGNALPHPRHWMRDPGADTAHDNGERMAAVKENINNANYANEDDLFAAANVAVPLNAALLINPSNV